VLFVVPGNEQRISRGVAMSRLSGENCQNFAKEAQFGGTIGESKDFVDPGVWLKDFTLTQHWMLYKACGWRLWGDSKTEL